MSPAANDPIVVVTIVNVPGAVVKSLVDCNTIPFLLTVTCETVLGIPVTEKLVWFAVATKLDTPDDVKG